MTILIDVDNTFWAMSETLLPILNKLNNTSYSVTDIDHWNWYNEHFDKPFGPTETAWFWRQVNPYPNAVEVIEQFVRDGHKVVFVTASGFTNGLAPKINRLLSFFDNKLINESNIIVAKDKSLIDGDILIDDGMHNLESFPWTTIRYIQPWNHSILLLE